MSTHQLSQADKAEIEVMLAHYCQDGNPKQLREGSLRSSEHASRLTSLSNRVLEIRLDYLCCPGQVRYLLGRLSHVLSQATDTL